MQMAPATISHEEPEKRNARTPASAAATKTKDRGYTMRAKRFGRMAEHAANTKKDSALLIERNVPHEDEPCSPRACAGNSPKPQSENELSARKHA